MSLTKNQKLIYNKCVADLALASATLSKEYYYNALPQCIIDAVYSIGVRYASTRNTVINYCNTTSIARISAPLDHPSDSHTVTELLSNISPFASTDYGATSLFNNHQKTSTTNGILKAEAVYRFAKVLKENKIETLRDIRSASPHTIVSIEREIKKIPGQKSGISFSYFLMLSGDDSHMKIDRWLLRFVGDALGVARYTSVASAYTDLLAVCGELKLRYPHLTPRLLDHTIWNYMK
jgi:hypothetical protein